MLWITMFWCDRFSIFTRSICAPTIVTARTPPLIDGVTDSKTVMPTSCLPPDVQPARRRRAIAALRITGDHSTPTV
jgi:hypothetical protein